jgi:uncharacterized protein (DUF1330 family)
MKNDTEFYMLNALWFKPDGGMESYQKYMHAVTPLLKKYNGKPTPLLVPTKELVGKFDADLIFFVKWPSLNIFLEFTNDPEYKKIGHFREDAITNSLLIKCDKL